MKRNIVINSTGSALVISNRLADAVKQISMDCGISEEIYAFDTYLHICYSFKVTGNGDYEIIEEAIPLDKFRSFAIYHNGDYGKVYKAIIKSIIDE